MSRLPDDDSAVHAAALGLRALRDAATTSAVRPEAGPEFTVRGDGAILNRAGEVVVPRPPETKGA